MKPELWGEKPYYSLDYYCKTTYNEKLYKIAINAGFTCPNRDGTLDTRGCIFCSQGGSGEFAVTGTSVSASTLMQDGISLFHTKKTGTHFIFYFQAYTNTYAPVERLRALYTAALLEPSCAGISIATRPDCLQAPVLDLLRDLQRDFPAKFIWVELGLQTIHEETAVFIRRGYPLSVFFEAVTALSKIGIKSIVHVIIGLPGENREMLLSTIDYLNTLPIFGIKLQLLHILKNTDLADLYLQGKVHILSMEQYLDLVLDCLTNLRYDIVIHRVTGDGPKDLLLAPLWSHNKRQVLNSLHRQMRQLHAYQGQFYNS